LQFAFICNDTQGGVQPYVALALGLQKAGHEVRLLAPENYKGFVTSHGIPFCPLSGDVQAFLKSAEFAAVAAKGFIAVQQLAIRKVYELTNRWMAEAVVACDGADVIVAGIGGFAVAEAVAEKLGVRLIQAHLQPLTPTGAFPGPLGPKWLSRFGDAGNRLGHEFTRQVMWQPTRPAVDQARRKVLCLPPAPFWGRLGKAAARCPLLYGYSRHVLPHPLDWGKSVHVTGYWFLDGAATYSPPPGLTAFLAAGPPPVVIGFGSMGDRDAEGTARMVIEAVQAAGVRAVLLSGWGGFGAAALGPSVHILDSAPHDWLYPRSAMVVHHGGAGTTGAMFRAGVPGVVIPFAAEQPFWGELVAALGCGPKPIHRCRLTAAGLAAAIRSALGENIRKRAAAIGALVRSENGVGEAVRLLTMIEK